METPIKVNRRGVTVETADLCVAHDNVSDCRLPTHLTYREQPTSSRRVRLCKYWSDSLAGTACGGLPVQWSSVEGSKPVTQPQKCSFCHVCQLRHLEGTESHVDASIVAWKEDMVANEKANLRSLVDVEGPTAIDHTYGATPAENSTMMRLGDSTDHTYGRAGQHSEAISTSHKHPGFRLNIDNLDYEIKGRCMTILNQNKSQHYVQLPLGILDKNENKTNDMIDVMSHLQNFVPGARTQEHIDAVDEMEDLLGALRPIPLGGDQLTCERIRAAHMARLDSETPEERLDGLFVHHGGRLPLQDELLAGNDGSILHYR
ncbi:hypothetical protein LSAT2_015832 [Lamellibrachia satsuma]|nr:hypothetical protein LSAT2_015832 [Lamellibrachia satsuma]